jgi:hypothetical protein
VTSTLPGLNKVMKLLERAGFLSTAKRQSRARRVHQPAGLITPDQQAMIHELYEQVGWTDQSRQIGFSKRCLQKVVPADAERWGLRSSRG